jgi:predicted MFS family arabinose efflux permease
VADAALTPEARGGYGRVLRMPGVARLAASYVCVMGAMTMAPVAFVLFAREVTGSFGSASLVLAADTVGSLAFAPVRGRLVDRFGPSPVVLALVVPSVASDAGLIVAGRLGAPAAVLVCLAFAAGAILPPVGSGFRTVFGEMISRSGDEHTGFALMTMLGELCFLTGPLLAGALVAVGSPTLAVAASAGLVGVGALAFATSRQVREHGPVESVHAGLAPPGGAALRTILGVAIFFGLNFGLLDVAYPAFATEHGSPASAGILLAGIALGLGSCSYVYGLRPREPARTLQIYPVLVGIAALGLAPLIAADSIAVLGVLSVVSGACFAPLTIAGNLGIERFAPASRAEAFSWLSTLYGCGSAAGAALAGQLVDTSGPRLAIAGGFGVMALATAVAFVRGGTLRAPTGA